MSVITVEDRIEILEDIAKNYLVHLTDALNQARTEKHVAISRYETPTSLAVRETDLQARVDHLTHKMKRIGML